MAQVVTFLSSAVRAMTVEPVMLMDGACKEAMLIYTENVQMNKICTVKLGYSPEVSCDAHLQRQSRHDSLHGMVYVILKYYVTSPYAHIPDINKPQPAVYSACPLFTGV